MNRLSDATLPQARPGVARPGYDRSQAQVGVVHFGPGAFFRAHAASYLDEVLARDGRWAVSAAALRSPGVRDALQPQDGLYTLAELDREPRLRVIGAVKEVLVAAETPDRVAARLASPAVRLVTLTVTEKGYALNAAGELDLEEAAIAHDLAHPQAPALSVVAWLARGLAARRAAGIAPFVTLSCDNLPDNGGKLSRAVARFAEVSGDRDLARWIEGEARFPRTMVDSITPATPDALRARVSAALGLEDAWPIQRERFVQWVIEDALGPDAPDLAASGATLARNVAPFEQAKLRLLNGAHSTLAYVGRLTGLETTADAMGEPRLAAFVERLMREAIAPTLAPTPELDLGAYVSDLLDRFRNPALRHELAQIAWDGSKKLPVRLFGPAVETLARGGDVRPLAVPVAAWMRFVRLQAERGETTVDPLAEVLRAQLGDGGPDEAERFLALEAVFPPALAADPRFRAAVLEAHAALARDPLAALQAAWRE